MCIVIGPGGVQSSARLAVAAMDYPSAIAPRARNFFMVVPPKISMLER
jgi:hypothetical protein